MLAMSAEMGDDFAGDASDQDGGDVHEIQAINRMFSSIGSNDLVALKQYIEDNGADIDDYVNLIEYSYNVTPQIFSADTGDGVRQVNPDSSFSALGFGSGSTTNTMMAAQMSTNVFHELMGDTSLIEPQYDVVAGSWPTSHDEVVLVLTESGGVSDLVLYAMGLRDPAELDAMVQQMVNEEEIVAPTDTLSLSYEEILDVSFKLVNSADFFSYDQTYGVWTDKSGDAEHLTGLVESGEDLHVSGIVRPNGSTRASALTPGIYYTPALTSHLIEQAAQTEVVQQQLADPAMNVFSGRTFADEAANPQGNEFDLSSLITVDEDAIAAAFTFDESALAMDLSGLSLDLSALNLDASAMNLDMSAFELDLSALEIDPAALPELDLIEIVGQLDFSLDDVDTDLAHQVAAGLVSGYVEFATSDGFEVTDVVANFPLFLESDEGQALVEQAEGIIDLDALTAQLQTVMSDYLQQTMTVLMGQVSEEIGTAIQTQTGTALQTQIGTALEVQLGAAMNAAMSQLASNMSGAMGIDQAAFMNAFQFNMDEEELTEVLMSMMSTGQTSFDTNLARLGYAEPDKPYSIDIYPRDFESKAQVIQILDDYNDRMQAEGNDDKVITYTDIVGTLMASVTDIINVVSYVLVAFVSISLVVSSIMIGVITYISVLERRKEIGILRSIGASKRDIRRVFNAETLIVGFVAGLVGIAVTALLTLPTNAIVESRFNIANVAQLPWQAAGILVLISMGLTFLAGLIPSSAASRKDPVEALRSE